MSMEPSPVVVVVADRPVGVPVLSRTATVILPSVFPWVQVTVPQPVGEPGKSAKAMSGEVTTPSVPMVDWRTSWGAVSYQAN